MITAVKGEQGSMLKAKKLTVLSPDQVNVNGVPAFTFP